MTTPGFAPLSRGILSSAVYRDFLSKEEWQHEKIHPEIRALLGSAGADRVHFKHQQRLPVRLPPARCPRCREKTPEVLAGRRMLKGDANRLYERIDGYWMNEYLE